MFSIPKWEKIALANRILPLFDRNGIEKNSPKIGKGIIRRLRKALCFFRGQRSQIVFGIAGIGDEHLDLLSKLCTLLEDEALLETLKTTDDVNWVLEQLS